MVCSKQTKQIASHVAIAIATYMQPVKLCSCISLDQLLFLKQLTLYHSLSKRTPSYLNMNWYVKPFLTIITWYHFISGYLKIYIIIQNIWHYNLLILSTGHRVFHVQNCAIKFVSKILIKCRQSSFWSRTTVLWSSSSNRQVTATNPNKAQSLVPICLCMCIYYNYY